MVEACLVIHCSGATAIASSILVILMQDEAYRLSLSPQLQRAAASVPRPTDFHCNACSAILRLCSYSARPMHAILFAFLNFAVK
jgi:hypothetical protein